MIIMESWQVNFHQGKLNLGSLVRMGKFRWILKLYTVCEDDWFSEIHLSAVILTFVDE